MAKLSKCVCGMPLPMHLLPLMNDGGVHGCSCGRSYVVRATRKGNEFQESGPANPNPIAAFDQWEGQELEKLLAKAHKTLKSLPLKKQLEHRKAQYVIFVYGQLQLINNKLTKEQLGLIYDTYCEQADIPPGLKELDVALRYG